MTEQYQVPFLLVFRWAGGFVDITENSELLGTVSGFVEVY